MFLFSDCKPPDTVVSLEQACQNIESKNIRITPKGNSYTIYPPIGSIPADTLKFPECICSLKSLVSLELIQQNVVNLPLCINTLVYLDLSANQFLDLNNLIAFIETNPNLKTIRLDPTNVHIIEPVVKKQFPKITISHPPIK